MPGISKYNSQLERNRGFTLVEMVVVAPIIILAIGAFIAVIINLTGEVLSSRGSNTLTYSVQDALNRIEADIKQSTTTLATNSIPVSSTNQGYVADGQATPAGSTVNFSNIDKSSSGGSPASLILNTLVTNGNPLSDSSTYIYLKDAPNDCSDASLYTKNTPLAANVIYFIAGDTLWRRVIMPSNYSTTSNFCGGTPWQQPSCLPGYTNTFCKTNDEKLVEGISPADFQIGYYTSAGATSPIAAATAPSGTDATRAAALQGAQTIKVSLTAKRTIAGRDIERSGSVDVTRSDTNASSIAANSAPTAVPRAVTSVTSNVFDGSSVRFTWPQSPTATAYKLRYTVNGGAQINGPTVDNKNRTFVVPSMSHGDVIQLTVTPMNAIGDGTSTSNSTTIPIWAPLVLKGSWANYDNEFTTAAYTKTKHGLVIIKGLIKNPSTPTSGTTIAQLPAGYEPSGKLLFGTATSANVSASIEVDSNGKILTGVGSNGTWLSLDTISFMANSTDSSSFLTGRTTLPLSNGFSNLSGYAPATYLRDGAGRALIQGTLTAGTRTDNTRIAALPAALLPAHVTTMNGRAANTFQAFAITPSANGGGVHVRGTPTTGAYSITSRYYPSAAATAATWTTLTLSNSWVSFGTPNATPQVTKADDNVVQLRGMVKSGTTTAETVVAQLAAGFRPKQRILTTVAHANGYARIDIMPNGQIRVLSATSNAWLSLDSISFLAEQ